MKSFLKKVIKAGSGSAPLGNRPIADGISFEKGTPEVVDVIKKYPWAPKDKRVLPDGLMEAPKFDDHTFPFSGKSNIRPSFIWNDEKPTPEEVEEVMNFKDKVESSYKVTSKNKQDFFPEVLNKIKLLYPEMKMKFPKPPTYVWNPKDENEKLDAKKLKDSLKVKLPDLIWSERHDGVSAAEIDFPDGTYADLAIGQDADHLTITYHVEGRS